MTAEDLETVHRGLRSMLGHYGRLAARNVQDKIVDSGSAVFMSIDGVRGILTAHHVLRGLAPQGTLWLQVLPPAAGHHPDLAHIPIEFELDPGRSVADARMGCLDAALILPPPAVLGTPWLGWFEADAQIAGLEAVRLATERLDPRGLDRLAAVIVGYPRFVRFEDAQLRLQAACSFPLLAGIERFTGPPPIFGRVPEIVLDVDIPEVDDLIGEAMPLVAAGVANLPDLIAGGESALGGYSGAPVMYFCANASCVLGIMREAGVRLGGQGFATCIDDVVAVLRASEGWPFVADECGRPDRGKLT